MANIAHEVDRRRLWRVQRFIEMAVKQDSSTELGGAMPTFVGLRHLVSPYPLISFDSRLVHLLGKTDISDDMPISEVSLPFTRFYLELGKLRDLEQVVPNPQSGNHVLEGAYVESGQHEQEGPGLYIMLTGSPVGRTHLLDDSAHAVFLSTAHPQATVAETLTHAYVRAREQSRQLGLRAPDAYGYEQAVANLSLVFKALLYLNSSAVRKSEHFDRRDLESQLRHLKSPAKQAKALRKLARVHDEIRVELPVEMSTGAGLEGSRLGMAGHWRRGHLRRQAHGPQMSLRKTVFISPTWIGADAPSSPKNYHVC